MKRKRLIDALLVGVVAFTMFLIGSSIPSCGDAANAQGLCRPRIYAPTAYYPPVYSTPYVAPYKEVVVKDVKVVRVVEQPYDYYGLSLRDQLDLIADAVAYRIIVAQGRIPGNPTTTPPDRLPARSPGTTPPTMPRATSSTPVSLKGIVAAKCIRCHTGGSNKIDLSNLDNVPLDKRRSAALLVDRGIMPDGGPTLSDSDVRVFDEWAGIRVTSKK